jgi:hypothetical protein
MDSPIVFVGRRLEGYDVRDATDAERSFVDNSSWFVWPWPHIQEEVVATDDGERWALCLVKLPPNTEE